MESQTPSSHSYRARHSDPMPNCHIAERSQDIFQNKSRYIQCELEMAWREFQKKCHHMKTEKCYVVMVKRAGSAVRWAWIWILPLPLTAVRPGTTHNLFEPTENPSMSPHCPRDSVTIPKATVKTLHDLARMQLSFLSALKPSWTCFTSFECSMFFPTKGTLHVLFPQLGMKCPPLLYSCLIHLVNTHSSFIFLVLLGVQGLLLVFGRHSVRTVPWGL